MKKVFISIALFAITVAATAQLKVQANGEVRIYAQTQDWWPAIRTIVPTKLSCAYNLWNTYYNKDVFFVCGEGYLWCEKGGYFGSDIRLKKNITPIESALEKVMNLQGVRYQYKGKEGGDELDSENNEEFRLGFIAQAVEKVCPEAVKDMPDGTKAMSYTDLIPVLTEAIKEQQGQIERLQQTVSDQMYEIAFLRETMDKNDHQENNSLKNISIDEIATAKLFQNTPNPFTINTEIRFEIPENSTSAKLLIHDMQGAEIKSYTITAKGIGNIIIQAHELPAGMYMYTLLVNNTIIDTKKMILTK